MSQDREDAYARARADPSIGVFDLEEAMSQYFTLKTYRDMHEVITIIRDSRVTWRSAPKAAFQGNINNFKGPFKVNRKVSL